MLYAHDHMALNYITGLRKRVCRTEVTAWTQTIINIHKWEKNIGVQLYTLIRTYLMSQKMPLTFGFVSDTYVMHGVQEFCQLVEPLPVLTGVAFPLDNGFPQLFDVGHPDLIKQLLALQPFLRNWKTKTQLIKSWSLFMCSECGAY